VIKQVGKACRAVKGTVNGCYWVQLSSTETKACVGVPARVSDPRAWRGPVTDESLVSVAGANPIAIKRAISPLLGQSLGGARGPRWARRLQARNDRVLAAFIMADERQSRGGRKVPLH
jgi:hypothetical protein